MPQINEMSWKYTSTIVLINLVILIAVINHTFLKSWLFKKKFFFMKNLELVV